MPEKKPEKKTDTGLLRTRVLLDGGVQATACVDKDTFYFLERRYKNQKSGEWTTAKTWRAKDLEVLAQWLPEVLKVVPSRDGELIDLRSRKYEESNGSTGNGAGGGGSDSTGKSGS